MILTAYLSFTHRVQEITMVGLFSASVVVGVSHLKQRFHPTFSIGRASFD